MATDYEWWLSRVWQGLDNRCALAEGLLPPTYKPSQPPINSCRLPWLWLSAPSLDLPGRASKYRGVEVPGHPLCMRQLNDTALSLQDGNHTGLDVESGEEAKVVTRDTGWREGRKLQVIRFLDIPSLLQGTPRGRENGGGMSGSRQRGPSRNTLTGVLRSKVQDEDVLLFLGCL
ncbi:hypothetical protein BO83DRAFT_414280 [Aspergillus eucalypticola CBS 122712]|uniref:Uncharacterized protein n=1 Tax=Aspergillus eucalypticola (strain CBS 122712 / IBT 29274) TaxID=1448314 RepID=A0A317W9H9_ASPEC|nr:uncharacterized protein BO83DRAFT_414280 [Aspergillus eucalypticola CBS 122712]PWY82809.1 hypothetical protein BO83DRAFT_414280 [Aspergillus eucalypticola CBS 122712]